MLTKICSKCGVEKPKEEFHLRSPSQPWPKSACKDCQRERARDYWRKKPLPKQIQRDRNLKKSFGIGLEEYNRLLDKQGNCCAICKTTACESGKNFAVDHDHVTGEIRGLLCMYCNTALGKFKDSVETLKNAINYLEKKENGYTQG